MTARTGDTSDSGDDALRREIEEATAAEDRRAERFTRRWRRFVSNLRDLTGGPDD